MKESSEVSAFYADYFPMILFSHLRLRSESVPPEILTPELIKLEIKRIHELLAAGTILDAWKRVDSVAILVLFEVSSEEKCRAIIGTLPFCIAGILDIEMIVAVQPYVDVFPNQ